MANVVHGISSDHVTQGGELELPPRSSRGPITKFSENMAVSDFFGFAG